MDRVEALVLLHWSIKPRKPPEPNPPAQSAYMESVDTSTGGTMFSMRFTLHIPLLFAALAPAALADIIHVPDDQPTIQAGIDAAQEGDTVLVAPGTYTGDGNRDISLWGKTIIVRSTDGPEVTIIDAQGDPDNIHRGFYLAHGEPVDTVIEGFTITGGYVIGDTGGIGPNGGGGGGGVLIKSGHATFRDCVITGNISETLLDPFVQDGTGGGIYAGEHADVRIEHCIIEKNYSARQGGGVFSLALSTSVIVENSLIRGNACGELYSGGGTYLVGNSGLLNSTVVENHSEGWAGGVVTIGVAIVRSTIVWGNSAANGTPQLLVASVLPPTELLVEHSIVQGGRRKAEIKDGSIVDWRESNLSEDPLFLGPDEGNYRLGPTSPGIDAASFQHPSTSPVDLDGLKRVQNCRADIGAYESPYFADCDDNELPDACQAGKGITPDCNTNGIPDGCEFADGVVEDCNRNSVPDECDPDTDGDGLIDDCDNCDLPNPDQADCQSNGIGDVCDLADGGSQDCNENATPDECDIASGASLDMWPPQGDGIPDDCQRDCNANLTPDLDDISSGFSRDADDNAIPDECECPIVGSDPFSGIIDARQPVDVNGQPFGWTTIRLDMCMEAEDIIFVDQFDITASNGRGAPGIATMAVDGDQITLTFDGPIPSGAMTTIRHVPSNTHVCMGFLPGDAGGNRKVHELDILQLIDRLNGVLPQTPRLCDIDRSGECDPLDILRLIDLMNGAGEYDPWLGAEIAPCP